MIKFVRCERCQGTGTDQHGICIDCSGRGVKRVADTIGELRRL